MLGMEPDVTFPNVQLLGLLNGQNKTVLVLAKICSTNSKSYLEICKRAQMFYLFESL